MGSKDTRQLRNSGAVMGDAVTQGLAKSYSITYLLILFAFFLRLMSAGVVPCESSKWFPYL
jgi:hypothetical protein